MATQKGRNWSSGDIVTAANLSSIERGVSEVAEEYTPTTWVNGNTVTATGLNNIEQGIVNASSGLSDLSIAQVTVVNNALGYCDVNGALATLVGPDTEGTTYIGDAKRGSTTILKLVLYKGIAKFALYGPTSSETITVEGSATYDEMTANYTVTGDCTFTVNPAS